VTTQSGKSIEKNGVRVLEVLKRTAYQTLARKLARNLETLLKKQELNSKRWLSAQMTRPNVTLDWRLQLRAVQK
jgi:hypothetical protein